MSDQPTSKQQKPKSASDRWTYISPSSGDNFAAHHVKARFERELQKVQKPLLEQIMKCSTGPLTVAKQPVKEAPSLLEELEKPHTTAYIAPCRRFLANKLLNLSVFQGEWVMISEMDEWDMLPEIEKSVEIKVEKIEEKESKIVSMVVGWVSGQK